MATGNSALKRWRRRLFSSPEARRFWARVYGRYIGFVFRTTRWQWNGTEEWNARLDAGEAFMFVLWHDRLAMIPFCFDWTRRPHTVLASSHRDADLAVVSAGMRGMEALRLEKDASNVSILRKAVRVLRSGSSFSITPDGPRGPRHVAKRGALEIASMAGVPVVPVSYSISRSVTMKSWDRFLWPLPFGRGVFRAGEPIELPPKPDEATLQAAQEQMEAALNALDAQCDREVGRVPPPGAEP